MLIRKATEGDLGDICILAAEVAILHKVHAPSIFLPPPDAELGREFWRTALTLERGTMFVAVVDGKVRGMIAAKLASVDANPYLRPQLHCRVGTIAVSESHQRRGMGRALLVRIEEWAKEHGADEVLLEVFSFNRRAIDFYESLAFSSQSQFMRKSLPK